MSFSGAQIPPAAPSPGIRPTALPSWTALKAIADAQRQIMLALLGGIVAVLASSAITGAGVATGAGLGAAEGGAIFIVAVVVGVRIWMLIATYRLARALGSRVAVLWAVGGLLPNLIGLIVLIVLSSRATKQLKAAGLKVGLLGAKLDLNPPPGFLCQELGRTFE